MTTTVHRAAAAAVLALTAGFLIPATGSAEPGDGQTLAQPLPPCMHAQTVDWGPGGYPDGTYDVWINALDCGGVRPPVSVDVWGFDPECQVPDPEAMFYSAGENSQYAYVC